MKRILAVEDELDIQELLLTYLRDAGYDAVTASDGVEAVAMFGEGHFDLILLDLMLPKIDGYGVCELIRKSSSVPIIMLTALDSEENQLKGFDLKIDDYVTKPFSMPVLLRKIDAVLRRVGGEVKGRIIGYKDLSIDTEGYTVTVEGKNVELTAKEFELLSELLSNQGRVMTRSMLLSHIWNYDFLGDERIVDSHIKNLRKKLDRDYIETVRGVGYRVEKE